LIVKETTEAHVIFAIIEQVKSNVNLIISWIAEVIIRQQSFTVVSNRCSSLLMLITHVIRFTFSYRSVRTKK